MPRPPSAPPPQLLPDRGPRREADLLSAADLADELGVSVRTIHRLKAAGMLPQPIRFSRKTVRYKRADVRACLEAHRAPRSVGPQEADR